MAKRKLLNDSATVTQFIGCSIKELPQKDWLTAALMAIDENPSNAPPSRAIGLLENPTPDNIAMLATKWWKNGSVKLGVYFMDGGSTELQQRILSHMNAWGERSNVKFSLASAGVAQVRIVRTPGSGYASFVGTDILQIPIGQPTMWLDSFSMSTPESEYRRVVRHETGHTLGCPHEHMRRAIVDRLDPTKTVAYFKRFQGWSAAETRQQVLTPIEEVALIATPLTDETSIMCYQLPGEITKDGQPVVGGEDINDLDFKFMSERYPLAVQPPPVGPPATGPITIILPTDYKAGTYTFTPAK